MKFTTVAVLMSSILSVLIVFILYWSVNTKEKTSDIGSSSEVKGNLFHRLKRSLDDASEYEPSGIESDVDDTRDTDLHDRRELLGQREINTECTEGYPCRKKRASDSVSEEDANDIDQPMKSGSKEDVTPISQDVSGNIPEVLTLPNLFVNDSFINIDDKIEIDRKISDGTDVTDTVFEDEDEDEDENDDELNERRKRIYDKENDIDDHADTEEDFLEKYKRPANTVDEDNGNSDEPDDKYEGSDNFDNSVELSKRSVRSEYEGSEEEQDTEENDTDSDENFRRRRRQDKKPGFSHHPEKEIIPVPDDTFIKDSYSDELYNPPYDLVPTNKRRSVPSKNEDIDELDNEEDFNTNENEKESDDFNIDFLQKPGLNDSNIDKGDDVDNESDDLSEGENNLQKRNLNTFYGYSDDNDDDIDNESYNLNEGDNISLQKRDIDEFNDDSNGDDDDDDDDGEEDDDDGEEDDDVDEDDDDDEDEGVTEGNNEKYSPEKRDIDTTENEIGEEELDDNEMTDNYVADDDKIVDQENGVKNDIKKKRNNNITKELPKNKILKNNDSLEHVNSEGKQNKNLLIRKPRDAEFLDDIGAVAYDEIDDDPNSGYSQWEEWGPCSATCGVGRSERRRKCSDENHCKSGDLEQRVCMARTCDD